MHCNILYSFMTVLGSSLYVYFPCVSIMCEGCLIGFYLFQNSTTEVIRCWVFKLLQYIYCSQHKLFKKIVSHDHVFIVFAPRSWTLQDRSCWVEWDALTCKRCPTITDLQMRNLTLAVVFICMMSCVHLRAVHVKMLEVACNHHSYQQQH